MYIMICEYGPSNLRPLCHYEINPNVVTLFFNHNSTGVLVYHHDESCAGQGLLEGVGQSPSTTQSDGKSNIPPRVKRWILVQSIVNSCQVAGFAYDKNLSVSYSVVGMCVCDTWHDTKFTMHYQYSGVHRWSCAHMWKILIPLHCKCCVVSHTLIPMCRSNL